jgi:hypothetical protein
MPAASAKQRAARHRNQTGLLSAGQAWRNAARSEPLLFDAIMVLLYQCAVSTSDANSDSTCLAHANISGPPFLTLPAISAVSRTWTHPALITPPTQPDMEFCTSARQGAHLALDLRCDRANSIRKRQNVLFVAHKLDGYCRAQMLAVVESFVEWLEKRHGASEGGPVVANSTGVSRS